MVCEKCNVMLCLHAGLHCFMDFHEKSKNLQEYIVVTREYIVITREYIVVTREYIVITRE